LTAPGITGPLVEVEDLSVNFVTRESNVRAVNGVTFSMMPGEVLCVLGESGSGKSVTMRALMRLLPPKRSVISGRIRVAGEDVLAMNEAALRRMRGATVSMIFQEPMTAFDPVTRVGDQITEVIRLHRGVSQAAARRRALDLFELVRIPSAQQRLDAYPHELSGGLRQRAMIALALSCEPKLLLADEPTTALDATVQIQVLILLRRLQQELGMSVIFVTHDLGVAAEIADRVAVMYAGRVVESGSVRDVLRSPVHPYTAGLLASVPSEHVPGSRLPQVPGAAPVLSALPTGCSFAPRCPRAAAVCSTPVPVQQFEDGRTALCHIPITPPAR